MDVMIIVMMYNSFISTTFIPDWFVSLAKEISVLAGFFTALGVLAKYGPIRKPIQYIWRKLVSEPVGEWFKQLIEESVSKELDKRGEPPKE